MQLTLLWRVLWRLRHQNYMWDTCNQGYIIINGQLLKIDNAGMEYVASVDGWWETLCMGYWGWLQCGKAGWHSYYIQISAKFTCPYPLLQLSDRVENLHWDRCCDSHSEISNWKWYCKGTIFFRSELKINPVYCDEPLGCFWEHQCGRHNANSAQFAVFELQN